MFGVSRYEGGRGSGGGSIIKSGHDIGQPLSNVAQLKSQFKEALSLKPGDVSQGKLAELAKVNGETKSFAILAGKVSKEKLAIAQNLNRTYSVVWQHTNAAARQELTWQKTTQSGLERLSETMLDLNVAQQQYSGFATYINKAETLLGGS